MSKEGSLGAPIRHPIDFEHPDFLNPEKLDAEMRRVFDIPHDFDLDFPHLMLRYRTAQKKLGKLPSVPTQLAQIDRNAKIGIMFSKIVNWASNIKNKLIRKILELITGIDKRVQLPKYNSETFSNFFKKNKDKINYQTPSKDRKVVIYSTCFVNFNKKNTGVAALKVLKKNGVEVQEAYPGCCGMPFLEQADLPKVVEQAKKVSKDLIEWIDKGYKVVTLTASCGLMLKFEWPLLLPNDEKIKKLSANVMDIDEYVVDIANNEGLAEGLNEIDGGVTVHHACHARAQNMGIKARDMLKLIPNIKIDVVERCAGHGGTFGVMKETHDLANKVGRPTARQIKTKNNKYMASDCPLAGKHLKQLEVDTNISNDEALHPIELVAKSYNL